MTITNGYCTLNELKHALEVAALTYTAATISFVNSPAAIADSASGLKRFTTGKTIRVSGSVANNRDFDVTAGGVDASITVSPAPTAGAAGPSVTITDVSDLNDDARLEAVITAASRLIDRECKRRFFTTTNDETRYFTAAGTDLVLLNDDLISVTTLKTDQGADRVYETTWASSDYDLLPLNAALDGEPYRMIMSAPIGSKSFPTHIKGVEIAGKFGYASSAPDTIREACILVAMRLWERRHAIFGIKGSTTLGEITLRLRDDPDVERLLRSYRKVGV